METKRARIAFTVNNSQATSLAVIQEAEDKVHDLLADIAKVMRLDGRQWSMMHTNLEMAFYHAREAVLLPETRRTRFRTTLIEDKSTEDRGVETFHIASTTDVIAPTTANSQ